MFQDKTAVVGAASAAEALTKVTSVVPQNTEVVSLRLSRIRQGEYKIEYTAEANPVDVRRAERAGQHKLPRSSVITFEIRRLEEILRERESEVMRIRARIETLQAEWEKL